MKLMKRLFGPKERQNVPDEEMPETVCGATDVGKVREANEDYFLIRPGKNLYIATDGMGGHKAGDVASKSATEALDDYLSMDLLSRIQEKDIKKEILNGIQHANKKVLDMAAGNEKYKGMGCTIVVALIDGSSLHVCHVGDARAYVCDSTNINLLTTDHSAVMELVAAGKMSMEEARISPIKNEITQAIGSPSAIEPGYVHHILKEGERVLLCSDGLWDMLTDDEIYQVLLQEKPAKNICEELIERANHAGGQDNITVIVIVHNGQKQELSSPLEEKKEDTGAGEVKT
jgi:PPM family protein phosphatase